MLQSFDHKTCITIKTEKYGSALYIRVFKGFLFTCILPNVVSWRWPQFGAAGEGNDEVEDLYKLHEAENEQ